LRSKYFCRIDNHAFAQKVCSKLCVIVVNQLDQSSLSLLSALSVYLTKQDFIYISIYDRALWNPKSEFSNRTTQNRYPNVGNKTKCDICNSKAARKARLKKERDQHQQEGGAASAAAAFGSEADPSEAAAGGAEDSPGAGAGPEGESAQPASAAAPPDASTGKQEDGSPPFCIDLVQLEWVQECLTT